MATLLSFEEMEAWKLSRELCRELGELIDANKFEKNFRLINQMEGSAGSIMDNIAEGFERGTRLEFIQFLGYAMGSSAEFRSQLFRALDRNYIVQQDFDKLYSYSIRITRMIRAFMKYLQSSEIEGYRKKK